MARYIGPLYKTSPSLRCMLSLCYLQRVTTKKDCTLPKKMSFDVKTRKIAKQTGWPLIYSGLPRLFYETIYWA